MSACFPAPIQDRETQARADSERDKRERQKQELLQARQVSRGTTRGRRWRRQEEE